MQASVNSPKLVSAFNFGLILSLFARNIQFIQLFL